MVSTTLKLTRFTFYLDMGDGSDEEYGKKKTRTRRSRQSNGIGSQGRRTRKSRVKQVSIDDDYDQIEPSHFCNLCGDVSSYLHVVVVAYVI